MLVQKYSFKRTPEHVGIEVGQFVHPHNQSNDVTGFISRVFHDEFVITLFIPMVVALESYEGCTLISSKLTEEELQDDIERAAYINPTFRANLSSLMSQAAL
jgi:hypothetical protein